MKMKIIAAMSLLSCTFAQADGETARLLRLGETLQGELTAEQDQRGLARFEFDSRESGSITITARSLLFDSYLVVWREGADGLPEKVAEDDDSGGWPHSRVILQAEAAAQYRIEVRSAEIPYCGREFEVSIAAGRPTSLDTAGPGDTAQEFQTALEKVAAETGDPACRVRSLHMRGWLLQQEGKSARALSVAEEALDIARKDLGPDHPLAAWCLDLKAASLQHAGSYEEAKPYFEQSLRIMEAALGPDDTFVGYSLNNLSVLLNLMGRLVEARPLMERAIAIQEMNLGPEHPAVLTSLGNLAVFLSSMGHSTEARATIERVVNLREKVQGQEHPDVAMNLGTLGWILGSAGSYEEALPSLERAWRIYGRALGPRHPVTLGALHNVAWMLRLMGRYSEAKPIAEESVRLRQEVLGPEHTELFYSINNLAEILQVIGAYEEAKPLFERALAIARKRLGPDHDQVGVILNNLAFLLHAMGRLEEAAPLFERALTIYEKKFGSGHKESAITLGNLASVRSGLGQDQEARALYERALAIARKANENEHPSTARNLVKYGQLLQKMGLPVEARQATERSLAIRLKSLGEDHPETAQSFGSIARILHQSGDPGALEAALSAERIGREHLALTARTLAESRALQYASVRASGMDLALTLAADGGTGDAGTRVWDAVVRSRALVLDEMASRHRALGGGADPAAVEAAQALRLASSRLANLMVRGPGQDPPDRYRGLLDDARREKESGEQALAEKSAAFRREQAKERLGLAQVLSGLPAASALVSYSLYQHAGKVQPLRSYVAFVGRAGSATPVVVPLGNAEAIDALVSRWRDEAGHGPQKSEASYREAGAALRRKIWDPIAGHFGDATMVFIVPDGTLSLVSLAALPADNGRYMIEEGPALHYLSSERDLLNPRTPAGAGGLLALGGAAFDAAAAATSPASSASAVFRGERSGCGSFATMRFEKLPATTTEVEEISGLWRTNGAPPATLTGADATEAAFKAQAAGHRVLHLATHGFFLDGRCASAMDATRGVGALVEASPAPASVQGENPLLLSGLALAGANQRATATPDHDDGILTAEEIATLDLSGVEWAVLSACDTGVGQVKAGEGVFGLRRAFQVAGAATVIMSLWSVEDESARRWMKALYEGRLKKSLGTAEAVRQAGLSVLRERRAAKMSTHPFFWAGFVAAGEWR